MKVYLFFLAMLSGNVAFNYAMENILLVPTQPHAILLIEEAIQHQHKKVICSLFKEHETLLLDPANSTYLDDFIKCAEKQLFFAQIREKENIFVAGISIFTGLLCGVHAGLGMCMEWISMQKENHLPDKCRDQLHNSWTYPLSHIYSLENNLPWILASGFSVYYGINALRDKNLTTACEILAFIDDEVANIKEKQKPHEN